MRPSSGRPRWESASSSNQGSRQAARAIILFAVILGGIGTLEGPIIGVAIYFLLRETMGNIGSLYSIVLSLPAIGVMLLAPGGSRGLLKSVIRIDLLPIRRTMREVGHRV
ncbi:ABC-type branched-subunit amino acid transport system permease subunit [Rhizobium sp. BK347]|nr:ABC-type branched-subunit amino acid transport system permease subunit [Rhizobium sp. BK284]MBB3484825.1 ABC-type branched-subunit amino acid transport system permease subunit [Rhizobium sp. BK347]